ncbi:MAG TPA: hypothetical protein PKE49_02070 [Leptospiraceae bacterium]|nr:hypothetical protein [Leptospirales bacterium]HMU83503.1 hypothetical protein [Leptospiraceae bacterium]HMW58584.1 hypothetical protein [Leptospiraceae bacterium]HMX55276.1 hypothetical protein [Leptospiraceae bacterium]HMY45266.1 hypothetical protein [Leptospiraceae bacterium]
MAKLLLSLPLILGLLSYCSAQSCDAKRQQSENCKVASLPLLATCPSASTTSNQNTCYAAWAAAIVACDAIVPPYCAKPSSDD